MSSQTIATQTQQTTTRPSSDAKAPASPGGSMRTQLKAATFAQGEAMLAGDRPDLGPTADPKDKDKGPTGLQGALGKAVAARLGKSPGGGEALIADAAAQVPSSEKASIPDVGKELNALWANGTRLDPAWSELDPKAWKTELATVLAAVLGKLEPGPRTFFAACMSAATAVKAATNATLTPALQGGDYAWANRSNFEQINGQVLTRWPEAWAAFAATASPTLLASDLVLSRCPADRLGLVVGKVLADDAAKAALLGSSAAKAALVGKLSGAVMASDPALLDLASALAVAHEPSFDQARLLEWMRLAKATAAWPGFVATLNAPATRAWVLERLPQTTTDPDVLALLDAMFPHITDVKEMHAALGRRFGANIGAMANEAGTVVTFDMPGLKRLWTTLAALPTGHVNETNITQIVRKPLSPVADKKGPDGKVISETPEERKQREMNRTFGGMGTDTGQMQLGYQSNVDEFQLSGSSALGAYKHTQADVTREVAAEKARLDKDKSLSADERKKRLAAFEAEQQKKVVDFGAANSFDHTVRHEVGHAVDKQLGLSDGKRNVELFGAWKGLGNAKAFFDEMLAADGASKAAWDPVLATLPEEAKAAAFANDHTSLGAALRELLGDKLALVEKTPVWGTIEALTGSGQQYTRAIPAVGAYRFIHDPSAPWARYSEKARRERGVSDYQWKSPKEWFAEVYAFYYDSAKPGETLAKRDPQMKTWLDTNVHEKGITPGKMKG